MSKRMLIAGGSGLIGSHLKKLAEQQGYEVVLLSRSPRADSIQWDPSARTIDISHPIFFDAIINLAGTSLSDGRWTAKRKEDIRLSRLDSTKTLETYLKDSRLSTYCYIGASACGIYGDHGDEWVTEETDIQHSDWLAETVWQWEQVHQAIRDLGIRTIITRIGLACSMEGGALKELIKTAPMGMLTYLGDGKQYWPWIHISDLAMIMLHCIHQETCQGIYFLTAPNPVTNRQVIHAANAQFSIRRIVVSAPRWSLRLLLGEMHNMLFDSCRGRSVRLEAEGYRFQFSTIEEAVKDLIGNS